MLVSFKLKKTIEVFFLLYRIQVVTANFIFQIEKKTSNLK